MRNLVVPAHAKVNLSLDVLRKRPDGYHEVKMIMQTLALHDTVTLEETGGEGIEIRCKSPWVPLDQRNIAYKAADLMMKTYGIPSGLRIDIEKRIPVAAGLAGGSANAAAVLKGMDRMFSLEIPEPDLLALGKKIGADVPYCIKGGTMLSEGIGEVLTRLSPMTQTDVVLVKPRIGVSTAWVYQNLNLGNIAERPDTDGLIAAVAENRTKWLARNMKNVLETVTVPAHPIIGEIKDRLMSLGALGSRMSGSGPTVFALFGDGDTARKAFEEMNTDTRWESILTHTENELQG